MSSGENIPVAMHLCSNEHQGWAHTTIPAIDMSVGDMSLGVVFYKESYGVTRVHLLYKSVQRTHYREGHTLQNLTDLRTF